MGKEHEFEIPVRDLDAAGKPYRFTLRNAWIRRALEQTEIQPAAGDGSLDVRVSKSGTDVVLRGKLAAELVVPCARCLEAARVSVKEDLSGLAVLRSKRREKKGKGDGEDEAAPDADMIAYDGETLVLDDHVRDELLLAVPMIPLCSEACPGISRPPE